MKTIFRTAALPDIKQMQVVRNFVDPEFAEKGIGKELHRLMINWYFEQTQDNLVLGTAPNTRAERFYRYQGWTSIGNYPDGEIKLELTPANWNHRLV